MFEWIPLAGNAFIPILIGIVCSTDETCSTEKIRPSTSTNVGFFRHWIEEKMKL